LKVHNDPRHSARVLALQSIFQSTEGSTSFDIKDIQEMDEVSKYDLGLFTNLTKELPTHRDEIKTLLKSIAIERPLEDISKTNLIILELAILETNILKLTPRKVAIDEAIELAREFGSDTDSKFVNGVLDKALTK